MNAPASSEQAKLAPGSLLNAKLAAAVLLSAGGPEVMVVSGGVVSTVHEYVAGVGSVLPAASLARTWKLWLPSRRVS